MAKEGSAEATIRDIKRKARRSEEKNRIVLKELRGEQGVVGMRSEGKSGMGLRLESG